MRTLAIGDIHGCFAALTTLERFVPFRPDDLIVTLGDYVDRGPDSRCVLDWLIDREETGMHIALKGNHDLMMLDARHDPAKFDDWIKQGGDATLRSYGVPIDSESLEKVPDAHWRFLDQTCQSWHESKEHFFVHANASPDVPLNEQSGLMLFWEHVFDPKPHSCGKRMICGHTSQKDGMPRNWGHAVCIDTSACKGGWLTCLHVETGEYWQSSQEGRTRHSMLKTPR